MAKQRSVFIDQDLIDADWPKRVDDESIVPEPLPRESIAENIFCPTGKGGGIDPTCKKSDFAGARSQGSLQLDKLREIIKDEQPELEDDDLRDWAESILTGDSYGESFYSSSASWETADKFRKEVWNQAMPLVEEKPADYGGGSEFVLYRAVNREETRLEGTYWTDREEHARPYAWNHFKGAVLRKKTFRIPDDKIADESVLVNIGRKVLGEEMEYVYEYADSSAVQQALRKAGYVAVAYSDIGPDNAYEHNTVLILREP